MAYQIKNIEELDMIDFSNLEQKKETVRKSIDNTKFIISNDTLIGYSKEEMIEITNSPEWESNEF
jgi:hypothetical protein